MRRKFQFVAFAFILGFTLAVPDFEGLDENGSANNDQAVLYVNEVAPGAGQERTQSTCSKLFPAENASPFSSSALFVPPAKAGRDLLQLLTLQKK